jgi:hypothetical protein
MLHSTDDERAASDMSIGREALLELAAALGSRAIALRRDECNNWRIEGWRGWVYAVPGKLHQPDCASFQIYCAPGSARAWASAKKMMAFAEVTLDGDDERLLFLDRLPTAEETVTLRGKLGIAKRREVSKTERLRLTEIGRATAFVPRHGVEEGFPAQGTATNDPSSPRTPLASHAVFPPRGEP